MALKRCLKIKQKHEYYQQAFKTPFQRKVQFKYIKDTSRHVKAVMGYQLWYQITENPLSTKIQEIPRDESERAFIHYKYLTEMLHSFSNYYVS